MLPAITQELKYRHQRAMTKVEKKWMQSVAELGCIVCLEAGFGYVPCCVHHILESGRRKGHLHTIGLCPGHHASGLNTEEVVSRHPWLKEFEKRYGTEKELWKKTCDALRG